MLWLVRALELDPDDASGIHHAIRVNLQETANEQLAQVRHTLRPAGLKPVEPEKASDEWVQHTLFSPDGKLLATAHASGRVRIWDLADGRERVAPLEHKGRITTLAFSPDGTQLWAGVLGRGSQLWTWDVRSGRALGAPVDFPGIISEFRPDGQALALHPRFNAVQVVDRITRKPLGPSWSTRISRVTAPVNSPSAPTDRAWPPANRTTPQPGASRAAIGWDIATGKERFQTGKHDGYHIYAIAWSPDGETVATGGHDHTLRLWDSKTGGSRACRVPSPSRLRFSSTAPMAGPSPSPKGAEPVTITHPHRSAYWTAGPASPWVPSGHLTQACGLWRSAPTARRSRWV